jgi:hypothetical protein
VYFVLFCHLVMYMCVFVLFVSLFIRGCFIFGLWVVELVFIIVIIIIIIIIILGIFLARSTR